MGGAATAWTWFAVVVWFFTFGGALTEDAWRCEQNCEVGVVLVPVTAIIGFVVAGVAAGAMLGWLEVRSDPNADPRLYDLIGPLAWSGIVGTFFDVLATLALREARLRSVIMVAVMASMVMAVRRWPTTMALRFWRRQLWVFVMAAAVGVAAGLLLQISVSSVGLGRAAWFVVCIVGTALNLGALVWKASPIAQLTDASTGSWPVGLE